MTTFELGGVTIERGERRTVRLPLPALYTQTQLTMPVHVVRGKRSGAVLFVSAAIHGDELNGIEIVRRLLLHPALNRLNGTLIAVPVVNVYGLVYRSRYLPDRRDLNRSFPGTDRGSLSSRVARLLTHEIVLRSDYGIDLHTGSDNRTNLPQIRASLDHPDTERLARAFDVPVILNANLRDGSMRQTGIEGDRNIPILIYEAGEALRFNELAIRYGVKGILGVLREVGMLPPSRRKHNHVPPQIATSSHWVRAPLSGIVRMTTSLGNSIRRGDMLAIVSDPLGEQHETIYSPYTGIVIGHSNLPLSYEGEAIIHIAVFDDTTPPATLHDLTEALESDEPQPPE